MKRTRFLFGLTGRVTRAGYLKGFLLPICLLAGAAFALFVFRLPHEAKNDPLLVASAISQLIILSSPVLAVLAWVSVAVSIKRIHDLNQTGWWAVLPLALFSLGAAVGMMIDSRVAKLVSAVFVWGGVITSVALVILQSVVSGVEGVNRFGPSPSKK